MIATDFIFDGKRASDYGLMIVSINSNNESVASGGDMEYSVAKTPNNDRFTFYGSQFNNVLTWNISIVKDPCQCVSPTITAYEESEIAKWLMKTDGYRWFQFYQEGHENIYYKVYINMIPNQIAGSTIGFDLTITSDCAYGFSNIITKQATINASTPYKFYVDNNINNYIFPKVTIKGKILCDNSISDDITSNDENIIENTEAHSETASNFYIYNANDPEQNINNDKACQFKNIDIANITMDSDNDIITGVAPNQFNWYFLRLLNGKNTIATNSESNIDIKIEYREIRRVIA